MSVVIAGALAGLLSGLAIGWVAHALRHKHRYRAAEKRWEATMESLQGQLALERLRVESHAEARPTPDAEPAPILEFPAHLARPTTRPSDSSTARA